ncbi:MAG: glycosyltransferase [Methanothrix sp.]|uniref:glycosyltransferase n=1 Tax=Methanothrix sp. TaxID=90426 RepID=UPI0032AFB431|nr:glycosyltransferase [Methanothrix sp.]
MLEYDSITKARSLNPKRLKVLHIAGLFPTKQNPVAGIFVYEHVKATALHCEVIVIYAESVYEQVNGPYEIEDNRDNTIRVLRIRCRKSPLPKTSYLIYMWGIFAAFRKLLREGWQPDVIHGHIYSAGVPAVLIGKRYGIPVVITEHYTGFPLGIIRGITKQMAKFAFEQANMVCPVSDYLRRCIEAYGIRARFRVVPNVVDTSLFAPEDTTHMRESNLKRLLLVALLTPKKGVPTLLHALALLKEVRNDFVLDIVGDGPNRAEYEDLSSKLDLQDIVRFHGFLKTKQEVAKFMKQCDIFILPSYVETFGVVLIEALACGKPVIASDIGPSREIITDAVGKLVAPGNSKALAEVINYMLDHYQNYYPIKLAEYVRQRYSYEIIGEQFYKIYKELSNPTSGA